MCMTENVRTTKRTGKMRCGLAALFFACGLTPVACAGADDYTVTVPPGETWSWAQAEAAGGPETSGRRLVKEGLGILAPGADLSGKGFTALVVNAGVYDATALNQFPKVDSTATLTVAEGATLRIGFDLNQSTTIIEVTVGGAGAAGEGGAICFTADTDMGMKCSPNWTLTSDTVFSVDAAKRRVDFSCNDWSPSNTNNLFRMNGHALRFKGVSGVGGGWYRFRTGPTIIQPGEMIFDNCKFSRFSGGRTRVWKRADDPSSGTIPCIRLVNGARCNFACQDDAQWIANVAAIDAEYGTEIGDMGVSLSDVPGTYTVNKLIGSPKILGSGVTQGKEFEHRPLIKSYVVRAADLLQGRVLSSVSNLHFTAGASISVDDGSSLVKSEARVVATAAAEVFGPVTGGDDLAHHTHFMAAAVEGNNVTLAWQSEHALAADEFPIFVPAGSVYKWTQATDGLDLSHARGRKLVKLGCGTSHGGDVAAAGCTELVVARGVYAVADRAELPVLDGAMKVTVRDGATFKTVLDLNALTAKDRWLDVRLSGSGHFDGSNRLGAFCFWSRSVAKNQWCKWTLDGDTLITLADEQANFSADSLRRSDVWNVWNMNGHALTLRGINGKKGLFRFRSGPTINNPGSITLDDATFSMYQQASMKVNDGLIIPVFKTVNGCTVNFANRSGFGPFLNQCVALCDFGPGTVMDNVTVHPTDAPGPTEIGDFVGTVTVTTAQTLTVTGRYTVRKADLLADPPRMLVAETNLAFAVGSTLAVDDLSGLGLGRGVTVAKCPKGLLSGCPARVGDFAVRAETADGGDCLRLWSRDGFLILVK